MIHSSSPQQELLVWWHSQLPGEASPQIFRWYFGTLLLQLFVQEESSPLADPEDTRWLLVLRERALESSVIFIRTEPLQSLRRATSFLLLRLTFCRGRTCALMKNTERRKRKYSGSLQLQLSNFLTLLCHHPLVSGVWVRLQRFTFRIILKFHVLVFASLSLLSFVSL